MLTAIWPSYANIPNHVPESVGMTTQGFCSYFLFYLLIVPLLFIPTHKLGPLLFIKAVTVAPMALAMLVYLVVKADGAGPMLQKTSTLHGSAKIWTCFSVLMSITGGYTTLSVNISDFSRFAKRPSSAYSQVWAIPILKLLTYIFGIIGTSAAEVIYGEQLWNPLQIIAEWQGSPGGRAAAFFCSLIWLFSVLTVNLTGNVIAAANDWVTLFPRYMNLSRGALLSATLGAWAFAPWKILASALSFLNFMSSYIIFLAPMAGIMICDYWIVKRGRIDVPQLYDPRGIYRYWNGINWRALVCMVVVVAPLLPGMINAVNSGIEISTGLAHL
jgi:nucleobase:cation symporter-1, NCS1 family